MRPAGDAVPVWLHDYTFMREAARLHGAGEIPVVPARRGQMLRRQQERRGPWRGPWNDVCEVCMKGGRLLMCYFCNVVTHPACMRMAYSNRRVVGGEWACDECYDEEYASRGSDSD